MLWSTQPAPLLVLARFLANHQLTKNKSHRVTPFWHNDTPSRVTVTFGARRVESNRIGTESRGFRQATRDAVKNKFEREAYIMDRISHTVQ